MSTEERRAKFQLIRSPKRVPLADEQFREPFGQGLLFTLPKKDLLIFLVFPRVTEHEFTKTLELAKPAAVLELRRSPRFDIGHLNRQEAFKCFEAMRSKYYDLASALPSEEQSASDPVALVGTFLTHSGSPVEGPIVLLISEAAIEQQPDENSVPSRITKLFASASRHAWETVEIPQFA